MRTASPLEHVIAHQDDYVRHIHGHFFRTLSSAACADAVQDAFIAAFQSEDFTGLDADQRGAWVRTRAYRNAIDQIRLLKGRPDRGAPERAAVVSLDELPLESLPGAPDGVGDDDPRADDAAAVLEAFNRLPDAEQRVIGLRHLDNLDRSACARLLGLSETQYKRKHTDAVRRLINLVIQTRPHDTCLQARTLIDLSVNDTLDHDSLARRDAHLAGCAHCRQYQRRSRGLLIFVPLPALAFSDRFAARLHGLLERLMPMAQNADAATTAGGAGALGAGGAKLAAVVAASVATVGGGTAVIHHQVTHHAPAKAAVVQAKPVVARAAAPTTTGAQPAASSTSASRAAAAAKARARAKAAARRKKGTAAL
ncbi:MAG: sigma-70 family polymerase sigma factor, partial [Ramlibacter sp.]|nr:sigma-70 family polymerase sigma factor [Ramlibacter sp.]